MSNSVLLAHSSEANKKQARSKQEASKKQARSKQESSKQAPILLFIYYKKGNE
jgi:hypothetical protein